MVHARGVARRRVLSVRAGPRAIKMPASLTEAEWKVFQRRAREDGRSVTGQISWLIRRHLEESEPRKSVIEPVAKVLSLRQAGRDEDMRAYWRSRSTEERVAEADRLRRLGFQLHAGILPSPGIEPIGRVLRRRA